MKNTLETTKGSLAKVRVLLQNDVQDSLNVTIEKFGKAETALKQFRTERLPSVISDLKDQQQGLNQSRGVFAAVSGCIHLAFGVLALATMAVGFSGAYKFFTDSKI